MGKVDAYLMHYVFLVRIMIMTVLLVTGVSILLWNFFAPQRQDLSNRVRVNFLNAFTSENLMV